MNAYKINDSIQNHMVIATDIAEAIIAWKTVYDEEPKKIELVSGYVIVQRPRQGGK